MILTVELNIHEEDEGAIKASLFEWYINHEIGMDGIEFIDADGEAEIF